MRVKLKSGAAAAAAAFLLLLLFHLTWPGHGIWLLVVGLLIGIAAAALWWRDRTLSAQSAHTGRGHSPFSDVGAFGLSGTASSSMSQNTAGVPMYAVLAPTAMVAILLFIGGVIGSTEQAPTETVTALQQNVTAIDRSRDGEPTTQQVPPPAAASTSQTTDTNASSASSSSTDQSSTEQSQQTAQVKPIVVAAPKAASPAEDEGDGADLVMESANTIEYTVQEGDTLYDIAVQYNSTVDALMNLNDLDPSSFIHPGDVLLIPVQDDETETDES